MSSFLKNTKLLYFEQTMSNESAHSIAYNIVMVYLLQTNVVAKNAKIQKHQK